MRHFSFLCSIAILLASGAGTAIAQNYAPMPAVRHPQNQTSRTTTVSPPARTMSVTVPVIQQPQPICNPQQTFPGGCRPVLETVAEQRLTTTPVRVEVSVKPEGPEGTRLTPIIYREPGFFKAIVTSAVSLVGATIAAPFRFVETLVPLDRGNQPRNVCGPGPYAPCPTSGPVTPPQMIGKCIPKPCTPVPVTCAPPGPSVAPLPPSRPPVGCAPFIPPMMVEEPPCEPQSLLGGLINLPSRLAEGRFLGDMGQQR